MLPANKLTTPLTPHTHTRDNNLFRVVSSGRIISSCVRVFVSAYYSNVDRYLRRDDGVCHSNFSVINKYIIIFENILLFFHCVGIDTVIEKINK